MYKILLSNDDGYDAPGLKVLFETLKEHAKLFVVAPQINNSGAGCSITTNQPMFETENDNGFISVNGRPADCVYLGIHKLAPWKPDLVISGINLGANMGEDLLYSGTVGAALEAKGLDFPSIAISAAAFHQPGSENHMEPNYKTAALVVLDLIKHYDLGSIDPSLVLNVNTPNIDYSDELEYRITSVGSWGPRNPPGVREESDGRTSYWTTHRENYEEDNTDCDIRALIDKKVSISPIRPFFSIAGSDYQNFRLNKK